MTNRRPLKFWSDSDKRLIGVAHRGGDVLGIGKENSLAAFQAAYSLGYRWFETDVVPTKDGRLLAIHGRGYQRHPNKDLPSRLSIQRINYESIRHELKIGGEPVVLLEELLEEFSGVKFFLDPKTYKAGRALASFLIDNPDHIERVCVGSFLPFNTGKLKKSVERAANKEIAVSILGPLRGSILKLSAVFSWLLPLAAYQVRTTGARSIHIPYMWILSMKGDRLIEIAHQQGLRVGVYTPNDVQSIKECQARGVDIIMSDSVKLLREIILEKDSKNPSVNGDA